MRFADGVATVEVEGAADHVIVTDEDGRVRSESWCPHVTGDYDALVTLFTRLRSAILRHDGPATAELLRYPFRVNAAVFRMVASADELTSKFDEVFTATVVANVQKAEPQAVFCRNGSAMLGDGVLWAHAEHGIALADVVNQ